MVRVLFALLLVMLTLGCIGKMLEMSGVTPEEIEELGLSDVFGISVPKKPKVNVTEVSVKAPHYVGLDILLINYSKKVYPGMPDALDVFIGNNYGGGDAINVTFTAIFPETFRVTDVIASVEASHTDTLVVAKYNRIEKGGGDVITIFFDVPDKAITGNVRKYYPISFHLSFYYSIIYSMRIPATSARYYREAVLSGIPPVTVKRTDGEIELQVDTERFRGILKIPDKYFEPESEGFSVGIPITIRNVGEGIVDGDVILYFIGVTKKGYLKIIKESDDVWNCTSDGNLNIPEEENKWESIGFDKDSLLIKLLNAAENKKEEGFIVCATKISGNERTVILPIKIKPSSALQNQIFEIPLYFVAVYKYHISKNIYILTEKT